MLAQNAAKVAREQLTLIQIFEEVRERGYDGGYDTVALRGRWTEIDNGFIPTATRTAGICGGTTVSWGEVELPRTGWGPHQDGRLRRARRYRQGAPDPGLVGDERRADRGSFRKILLSPEASESGSGDEGCSFAM